MRKNQYKICAFTLVELLVIIVILAILSTISTVYFFENFETSRDASRNSNLTNIATNLELYYNDESSYPTPDSAVDIAHNWAVAWTQGVFWKEVIRTIRNFGGDIIKDPKYDTYFSYSTANSNREYQIASIYEELEEADGLAEISFIPEAHAVIETAQVFWDFNNFMVRTKSGSTYHYIATPSIIASDLSSLEVVDIISWQKLVYDEFFNLPASYSEFLDTNGGFNFNVSDPIIFSGSTQELKTQEGLENFVENLQYIYSRTPTESFDRYASFLQDEGVSKIKLFLTENYKISFSHAFSCQDLHDQDIALNDGYFTIDPDGSGPLLEKSVYCDVRNDGSAWTQVGWNYIWVNGWDFSGGNDISTNYYTLYESSSDNNTISMANPWSSSYVMHQTWDHSSNYEVHFDDFDDVDAWQDIRMSLWVTDEDGAWSNTLELNPESGYMFHNRLYYTDGTFSTNGTVEVLDTQSVWGKTWKHLQVLHRVRKEPQSFSWFLGLDTEDTSNLYFTGVELELFYH